MLAGKIEKLYCSNIIAIPTSPSSQSSDVNSYCSSSESDSSSMVATSAPCVLTEPALYPDPSLPSMSNLKPQSAPLKHLAKKVTGFKKKFRSLVIRANVDLTQKKMPSVSFYHFKVDLTKLPMLGKHSFLQRKKAKILRAKNFDEVFDVLDPYWNYVDYSLLEDIVKTYCNRKVRKRMQKYKDKLHKFEKATSVNYFTSVAPENHALPSKYSTLTGTLTVDASDCSLYHAREVRESIAEQANLEPYITLLHSLHASSVVMIIAFPRVVRQIMEQSLNTEFLQHIGIVPDSVVLKDTHAKRDRECTHDLNSQCWESFESPDMPDPPQNVKEEVSIRFTVGNNRHMHNIVAQSICIIQGCFLFL